MSILSFISLFKKINERLKRFMKNKKLNIIDANLDRNPRYPNWGKRAPHLITKIIIHQSLADWTTKRTHEYHISKESHLKPGTGAPAIAYHYTIERDGTIYKCNEHTDITWHTAGENISGLGICILGDFSWKENVNGKAPTQEQIKSLRELLNYLTHRLKISKTNVYGHKDFGKESCPGFVLYDFISDYKDEGFRKI